MCLPLTVALLTKTTKKAIAILANKLDLKHLCTM